MRFNEFTPTLFEFAGSPEAQQADSPKQFLSDVDSGLIDPDIAQKGMDYIAKVMEKVKARQQGEEPAEQPPEAQPQQEPQQAQAQPQRAQPQAQRPITPQAQRPAPQAQRPVPGAPIRPVGTNEALEYTKSGADEIKKSLVKQGATYPEIMDAITFIYKGQIVRNCKVLMAEKMYKPEAAELLANMFYELPASFHQRVQLSNALVKTGVLDLTKFDTPHEGNLADLIAPKFRANKAVVAMFLKLKTRKDFPTQVSAANKGAGEDLITIMGKPVLKLSPGDLNIDGKEVEIKAMGARLKGFGGSDIYGNPVTIYGEWAKLVSEALGEQGNLYMQENGKSLKKYFHFGLDNLAVLSQSLAVSRAPNKQKLLVEAFDLFLQTLYPLSDTKMRNRILSVFTPKGFDVEAFRKAWFLFSYDYYALTTADKKTGAKMDSIMFMNQGDDTYQLVTDAKQIDRNWDKYELGSDLFNWKNPTGAAPKITYGKEKRAKRVVSKK